VRLRPLQPDDVAALLGNGGVGFASVADRDGEAGRLRALVDKRPTLEDDGFVALGVQYGDEMVGDIQARAPRNGFPPGVCEIGLTLFADAQGQGIGTQAVRLLTDSLHEDGWPRVQASTAVDNIAMRRVLERCGYAIEGVLRSFAPDGPAGRADYVMYASVRPG
jgi:RimJ/RimL family protein N-acetyltransferase